MSRDWSEEENDRIVADYFAMLAHEMAGRTYSKAGHRRRLTPHLADRSKGAIEFKHQNISAVLQALGMTRINGYRPAQNYQQGLVEAVGRWFARNPALPEPAGQTRLDIPDRLEPGPPPTRRNREPPALEGMLGLAHSVDMAGRDERNRTLGRAGEKLALAHERAMLRDAGRSDLAERVRWVSQLDGDGAGYDIASFQSDGRNRLLEVKTTSGWEYAPFHITRNELAVSRQRQDEWRLLRIWDALHRPRAYELAPPLEAHVLLTPTTFLARFDGQETPGASA